MSDQAPNAVLRGAVDLSGLRNRHNAPPAGAAPADAGGFVVEATDATFGQLLEISQQVPVVVDLWATWCEPCLQLTPLLETVTKELGGKVLLAKVDVDQNPQIAQAFRAESIPLGVALIKGQPAPMFTGAVPEEQVREVFGKLLELAASQGVAGSLAGSEADEGAEPAEPELPPLHQEAFAAIEEGDYARAIVAYEKALAENPRDEQAHAGLGQVKLLDRVQNVDLQEARAAAAAAPTDIDAQFLVADLDVAGGHVDDAFGRLLDLFADLPSDERGPVQARLVELFGLVGDADPRVLRARGRLSSLLF